MNEAGAPDRDLVERYLGRREEAAFVALYRRHTPALFGLAARLCGGERADAEEIVQEAWVRAAESLAAFRWQSNLRTWLSGVVVNGWRERARARRREPLWDSEEDLEQSELPVSPAEHIDLERAVGELPDGFRAVLVLHDVEGLTHAEIGELLGIEVGTSKSQLARARQAVRRRLRGTAAVFARGEQT